MHYFENELSQGQSLLGPVAKFSHGLSTSELLALEMPEARWLIPNILPEGLTLLAGRPKVGKSYLAEQWSLEIGKKNPVIHLALEYSVSMLQQRVRQFDISAENVRWFFAGEINQVGKGGLKQLQQIVSRYQPKIVIIDVLTRFLGSLPKGYEGIYNSIGLLKDFAAKHSLNMLILHHLRKPDKDRDADIINDVLGSSAYAGAPDNIFMFSRGHFGQYDLTGEGRLIKPISLTLEWQDPAGFEVSGSSQDDDLINASSQAQVLEQIRKNPATNAEIAEALKMTATAVSNCTKKLLEKSKIFKDKKRKFRSTV